MGVDIFGLAWLSSGMRRHRRQSSSSSSKKPAKDFKKLLRMAWVACLPPDAPLQKKVVGWFAKAGFTDIRIEINGDLSMVNFSLEQGENLDYVSGQEIHAVLFQMLRQNGVNLMPDDLFTSLDGDSISGAFCPTVLPDGRVLPLLGSDDAGEADPALN